MAQNSTPYDQLRAQADARDKPYGRYLAVLVSAAILAIAVSFNAFAGEAKPTHTAKPIWTDHNSSDPGRVVADDKAQSLKVAPAATAPVVPPKKTRTAPGERIMQPRYGG